MTESVPENSAVKPKRARLQFGLGGMVLFVLFAGSVATVIVRWEPWIVESVEPTKYWHTSQALHVLGPDFKFIEKNAVQVVDSVSGKIVAEFPAGIERIAYPENYRQLMIIDKGATARVWDLFSGRELYTLSFKLAVGRDEYVIYSNNGKLFFANSALGERVICEAHSGEVIDSYSLETATFPSSISPDSSLGCISLSDGTCILRDFRAHSARKIEAKTINSIYQFSPDGKSILISDSSGLCLWDIASGKKIRTFFPSSVVPAALSTTGKIVAAARDRSLLLLDSQTGECIHDLHHPGEVIGVRFSSDGNHLITNFGPRLKSRLWDVKTGKLNAEFNGAAEFAIDGKRVYEYRDGMVQVATWAELYPAYPGGHLSRPEVWLAIIFGSLWLWRTSVWWRRRRAE